MEGNVNVYVGVNCVFLAKLRKYVMAFLEIFTLGVKLR